jgi:hypothetical protein
MEILQLLTQRWNMIGRSVRGVMAALAIAAAPFSLQDGRVEASTAECQAGTCCGETGSTCVIGGFTRWNAYYKASGSCDGGGGTGYIDYKDIPW